ncbi:MAG: leucyl aminopeptidase family protein [Halieaceae bacterium]|nr:leucyl aminopeptidase family protein [Halieaceae bacterium]
MNKLSDVLLSTPGENSTPIVLVLTEKFEDWQADLSEGERAWLGRQSFTAKPGQSAWLEQNGSARVICGWDGKDNLATLGHLPMSLPEGDYHLESPVGELQVLGWAMGSYQFNRYKTAKRKPARLFAELDESTRHVADAVALGRDLINTPAEDMKPSHLAEQIATMAETFNADLQVHTGDELLDLGARTIHTVGRAAEAPPVLADLTWGDADHPKITLVGKGVTFDSGGLDIKPGAGMRLMKKDMGGAAIAIGLAHLIMATQLPVRLRLLIPAAENAISGNAFRPGDVISTYKGLTVEIDNTDAEGRLLLCDALAMASEDKPDLIVDFATLTGAARVAVGTEISAMFSTSDEVAQALQSHGELTDDAVWRLPIHEDYEHMIKSNIADVLNCAASGFAGATTAALFLKKFVSDADWVHFDIMAFNTRARPGRPEGGEPMGLRAVYHYIAERYGPGE